MRLNTWYAVVKKFKTYLSPPTFGIQETNIYKDNLRQATMARIAYFLVMMFVVVAAVEAFKCNGPENQRASALCSPFTRSSEQQEPSHECCKAYKAFFESAKTKEERRELCFCEHQNIRGRPANVEKIDALSGKCGVPFMFSADLSFDCNT